MSGGAGAPNAGYFNAGNTHQTMINNNFSVVFNNTKPEVEYNEIYEKINFLESEIK